MILQSYEMPIHYYIIHAKSDYFGSHGFYKIIRHVPVKTWYEIDQYTYHHLNLRILE